MSEIYHVVHDTNAIDFRAAEVSEPRCLDETATTYGNMYIRDDTPVAQNQETQNQVLPASFTPTSFTPTSFTPTSFRQVVAQMPFRPTPTSFRQAIAQMPFRPTPFPRAAQTPFPRFLPFGEPQDAQDEFIEVPMEEYVPPVLLNAMPNATQTAMQPNAPVNEKKCSYCKLSGHNYTSRQCHRKIELMKKVKEFTEFKPKQSFPPLQRWWFSSLERIDYIMIGKEFHLNIPLKTKESTEDIKRKVYFHMVECRRQSKDSTIRRINDDIKSTHRDIILLNNRIVNSQATLKQILPNYNADSKIVVKTPETEVEIDCPICFDCVKPQYVVQFGCNHQVCSNCTYEMIQKKGQCPMCRTSISNVTVHSNCIKASLEQVFR